MFHVFHDVSRCFTGVSMDQALRNALKRKKELETELAEIAKFIDLHGRFSGTKREKIEPLPVNSGQWVPDPEPSPHTDLKPGNVLIRHKRGQPDDFANIMARVISDIGRPLTRSELVAEMEKRDVEIPSEDKERYLGTILWRHRERFVNFPRVGYWLSDRPWAATEYDPRSPHQTDDSTLSELARLIGQSDPFSNLDKSKK